MKNSAKKLLAMALVLMMTLAVVAIPASADASSATNYADAVEGDLLYTVNFNGDSVYKAGHAWAGMKIKTVSEEGRAITLQPSKNDANEAAAFGGEMNTTNYPAKGNSYTMVFTVTASDADQEIGLYPDWSSGFVVVPGKNQFKYNKTLSDRSKNETIVDYTEYNGTGSLTQTYAIEYKLNNDFSAAEYNLYVSQSSEWVLLYSLDEAELAAGPNWSTSDYETVIRFYRDSKIANQTSGTVTVSDVNVYKGMAVAGGYLDEGEADSPANEGKLLYTVNFNGDSNMAKLTETWDGFGKSSYVSPSADGSSVTLQIASGKWAAAGAKLNGLFVQNGAYTFVFTVTANDDNEEVGLCLDHATGFVVNPGQNTFRYTSHLTGGSLIETTEYDGTGELTQTYAIEVAGEGSGSNSKDQPYVDITTYKLYNVTTDGSGEKVWNLAYSLTETQLNSFLFDWGDAGDCDGYFYARFSRDRKNFNEANDGTVTISDFTVYEGLVTESLTFETEETPAETVDGDLLYTVNFNGDNVFNGAKGSWSGAEVTKTETSVTMKTKIDGNDAGRGSAWGADLNGFTILNKTYTTVFTVEASDADEEIGFLPCDWAGFVVTPGQNAYRFITTKFEDAGTDGAYENIIERGAYSGTKSLTQTYAIEIKTSGTEDNPSVDAYNLYVAQNGEWVLACSITDIDESVFDWFYYDGGVYEEDFTMRFYRRCYILDKDGWATSTLDGDQEGTVTVSDVKVYQGLVATDALVDAPNTPVTPVTPVIPDNENTDNENTDNENTGNGNNGSVNTETESNKNNDTEKPADTSATTDAVTEIVTEAETTDASKLFDFGCEGTVGVGSVVLLLASAAGTMIFKKKED